MNVQVAIAAGDQNTPSSQRVFVSVASARPSRRILFSSSSATRHHPRLLFKFSVHGWLNTIGQILFSCLALNTSLRKRNCWIHAEGKQLLFAAEAGASRHNFAPLGLIRRKRPPASESLAAFSFGLASRIAVSV